MDIKEFIATLKESNFTLTVENEKLILKGDKKNLSKAELNAIKSNEFVINYIRGNKSQLVEYLTLFGDDTPTEKRSKNIAAMYRLSGLQQGMLFHGLYDDKVGAYIEQFGCDLIGVDLNVLNQSWQQVINGHSILRTSFNYDAFKVPVQIVHNTVNLPFQLFDFSGFNAAEQAAAVKEYELADRAKAFDFKVAPLMRLALLKLGNDRYRMLWTSHHILFDGWSLPILMGEFLTVYEALKSGEPAPVKEEDRFEDYIRYIDRIDKVAEEAYWRNYLKGLEQSTLLPFIGTAINRNKGMGSFQTLFLLLDQPITAGIQQFAQRHRITVNTLIQGVWAYLLHQYTGNSNIVYGVIVSGRPDDMPGVEQRVGMYINTMPFHAAIDKNKGIVEWLQEIQEEQVNSRQYQFTPLHVVQGWSGVHGDWFDSLLTFENYPVNQLIASRRWALQVENVHLNEHTNYPLSILIESGQQLNIRFNYNEQLLHESFVNEVKGHFENVLLQLTQKEDGCIADLDLLTVPEQQQLLNHFNATTEAYPQDKTIIGLFEEQVIKSPESIAIVFEETQLTYHDLHKQSNQLAHYLVGKGIGKESLVPVCIERGPEMIVGLLAILKAGAAYVPVDPEYPEDRIRYMLEDTGATIVVSSSESRSKITGIEKLDIVELDSDWPLISRQSTADLMPATDPHQLAYVIYTSGSTGKPKGVMIEHTSVVNLLMSVAKEIDFQACSIFMSVTTFSFDICYLELYMPLVLGGKLLLMPREVAMDGFKLAEHIHSSRPTHMQGTPSTWQLLMDAGWQNMEAVKILVGGEALKEDLKLALTEKGNAWNVYGPTETTIWSTMHKLSRNENVLIGAPIANTTVQIVNKEGKLVPIGVAGEILIGGVGLARGYFKRPELTAEKFISNSFGNQAGSIMYRTGDLGRWLPGGKIECLGRIDEQVKIRGYRIELGEIETVLQQTGLVRQSVVLAREDKRGNKRLIGYIVPEASFDKQLMQEQLRSKLPEYMVPALWMELENLPLTPNGKIDKKALPDPDASELVSNEYIAPRNELESKLSAIWQELLQVERVGVHDNFFELGGHSLLAMRLATMIRKTFEVEVAIKSIFSHTTIDALAKHLALQSDGLLVPPIKAFSRPVHIPLSFSQERLWFIHQLEGSTQYHLPAILRLNGALDFSALQTALFTVVERHESLRSVIYEDHEEAYQKIIPATGWNLSVAEGAVYKNDRAGLLNFIRPLISQPFDLSNDYMLRATLLNLDSEEHVLVVTMHHIASDGWSLPVIVKEVVELYSAAVEGRASKLKALEVQYADYAVWQRNYLQGSVLDHKIGYWKDKLIGVEPLQLPTDFARHSVQSTRGTSVGFTINLQQAQAIQQLSQQQGATLFMTLLAAFKVLLYRYSGQQDICVGTPIAGRQQEEVEGLIGFFVNTLALRTQVNEIAEFTTLLAEVRNTTMDAYEHQEAPFEKVVEAVTKERDLGRSPLFQVMFVLQNTPDAPELALPGLTLSGESLENHTSKFDLSFYITETNNGLQCSVEYCTDLFRANTISRMIGHYKNLLTAIVQSPQQKIGLLPILSAEEQTDIITALSGPTTVAGSQKTLVDLFEAQASISPQSIALVFEKDTLRYQQLNDRSNQLANYLRSKNVQAGDLVPICMDRGFELTTGILGILKAGATYVPVDAGYPEERINYILEDTNANILLTNKAFAASFSTNTNINTKLVCIDDELASSYPSTKPSITTDENIPACIIYTSGSTGRPKGVLLSHAGIINRLDWMYETYPFEPNEKNAIKTSVGFVDHIWELFGALCAGIPSVIFPQQTLLDLDLLINELTKEKITRWVLVPSLLKTLLNKLQEDGNHLPHLKYWTSSGETLPFELVKDFYQHFPASHHRLLNIYGSSEVTADVSCYDTGLSYNQSSESPLQQVPIGKPIFNTTLYLLDQQQQLVAQGVAGEIYVGGIQVAQGYLNLPELTAERFINDLFSQEPGAKLFRTGDYGRLLEDGNIVYLGRIDDQVKIRGNRVELGEIETVLRQQDQIQDCVVIAKTDADGNNNLIGYLVAESTIDQQALSTVLRDLLPDYMVPVSWVQLEALPLTASGKIDKKALPAADVTARLVKVYTAPTTALETQLAIIWQQLLKKEQVGIHDNFFELGGHSLLAMRVVSHIRKELSAELSIKDLFFHPTIATLAVHLQRGTAQPVLPAIEVLPRPEHIPLSFSQERLWFIDRLEGSYQYHLPIVLKLTGELNNAALANALQQIIDRHEILRTQMGEMNGIAFQCVQNKGGWKLDIIEGSNYKESATTLKSYIDQLIKSPFDLSKDYPVRGTLIQLSPEENILVVTMHHIASDAWSISIIVREVVELYNSFIEGREASLPDLPLQYADYAVWQRNYLQGEVLEKKISYWKQKLEGLSALQLPTDFIRPTVRGTRGAAAGFRINKQLTTQLQELSRQQGASLFMVLLAAFKVLLQRYSGQQDISVGTSIASRQQKELEGLIGFFVNTLTLRDEVTPTTTFTELLQQVKQTTLEAYEHQELPFEKVVETVVTERDMSRSPLFQVMLVLQNTPEASKLKLGEVALSGEPITTNISKFDITFFINETAEGLQGKVEYSTDLYEAASIARMMVHFENLLTAVVNNPQEKIGLLPMLKAEEQQQLLEAYNDSTVDYPKDKSIVDLFEAQVVKTPENAAIVFEEEILSYRELNERSNQLAHYLQSKGITKDSLVPLYVERSAAMMVAMLGIMKSGAAYVPIDTDFPQDRISNMLEDTGANMIVSSFNSRNNLTVKAGVEIIEVENVTDQSTANLTGKPSANQLAYVIYTSGSTGKPKGVMIEHQSLADYYYGLNKHTQIDQGKSFALVSTIATDLGNTVIFAALLSGGTLHVFTKESVSNIEYLHEYFSENKIDCLKIVPSHWKALINDGDFLLPKKLLVFGGEALPSELVADIQLSGSPCRVVNHYGPTETTIGKLLHVTQPGRQYNKTIPIGKPFSNTSVYVLSAAMQLCPTGIPGQLYIAGDGVARGYYNNESLTNEKFIKDPFQETGNKKMYGTGDLVKWLPDGNIEFIGRVDDQVKIRGYRIELGEIESILQQSSEVSQAVVLAREDKQGDKRLVAYIVPEYDFDRESITAYLRESLPEYMIPSVLIELESLPLTANGKVDRKALPDPETLESTTAKYTAPRNETESKLAAIWEDILEVEQVGIHDDFFELGGHSLLAVRLVSAIRKAFTVEMPIGDIFDYPTVALLSKQLTNEPDTAVLPVIEKADPRPERIPLSFSQERLWFIDQMGGSVQYHVPAVLKLSGTVNKEAIAHALKNIVNRHEVLRTVYREEDGQPYQVIKDASDWQLVVPDSTSIATNEAGLKKYIQQLILQPYDLSADYMLRAAIISLNEAEHILLVTLHHIASDGWSRSILVNDFAAFYSEFVDGVAAKLSILPIQYADYAIWQRNHLSGALLEKKIAYWQHQLQGVSILQLPTDYPRPAMQTMKGAMAGFHIEKELSGRLQLFSQQQGATLFMTLLAAFKVLLYRYSGQEDVCVGTPIAGRQQEEVESLIGFFVNTLALRTILNGEASFTDLLQQVKATLVDAYANQELPFEKVVEAVIKERDMSHSPVFQVMLVLRNTPEVPELVMKDVTLSRAAYEHTTALFELTLFITENEEGLSIAVEYKTDLFAKSTIERMMGHFEHLLQAIVATPEKSISALPMLQAGEVQQLLVDFNNTKTDYPTGKTLVSLFEEQVEKSPDNIAVIFEDLQYTYRELNERSNQLANYLRKKGIQEESLVPICLDRSLEMIVGIWAIVKAGGAYVPIDPEYPGDRIRYMLQDTSAAIALCVENSIAKLSMEEGLEVIAIDTNWPLISQQPVTNLTTQLLPNNLAYVIYTSGSTGKPKAVLNEHAAVVNRLQWAQDYFGLTTNDVVLQKTTFCFDVSVWELFWPLLVGSKLVFAKPEGHKDPAYLKAIIDQEHISMLHFVPSMLGAFLYDLQPGDCSTLKKVLSSGEALKPSQVASFVEKLPTVELHNLYGPTEAAIDVTCWSLDAKSGSPSIVPIGKPVANTAIYILDKANGLVPFGGTGELHIGGVQVARGYLNRADLTAEKFVANPFVDGGKMYRTGDIGRWLPDGNIEYLGRIDDQVKVSGFRIELGEIETILEQSAAVKQAVVLAREDKQLNKRLVAYIVPNGMFNREDLVQFLSARLPLYMVPALWVGMESFPLTSTNKVNKKALPDPDTSGLLADHYVAPGNEMETMLVEIWQDLLGVKRIGIHDNFFTLGGHSLMVIKLVSVVKKRFNLVMPVPVIFKFPTVHELGNYLEWENNKSAEEAEDDETTFELINL